MNNVLSYNSNIELRESFVITYRIYVLKNPYTQEIFYVGQTRKELKERLTGHLSSLSNGCNQDKNDYILELLSKGQNPIIEEIEIIHGTCQFHAGYTTHRELYWINHYKDLGVKLYNHNGIKKPHTAGDYERYLIALQENKLYLWFYYVGRTRYGIAVYDEEKMNEDGFEMETYGLHPSGNDENNYTPPTPQITYEYIYDDENPDYIRSSQEEI